MKKQTKSFDSFNPEFVLRKEEEKVIVGGNMTNSIVGCHAGEPGVFVLSCGCTPPPV